MTAEQRHDVGQQALQTFLSDLPDLFVERPGQWVAYRGRQQICFAEQKHLLYEECFRRGLARGEFVAFCIEPQESEIWLGPVITE